MTNRGVVIIVKWEVCFDRLMSIIQMSHYRSSFLPELWTGWGGGAHFLQNVFVIFFQILKCSRTWGGTLSGTKRYVWVWKGTGWSCLGVCLDMVTMFFLWTECGKHESWFAHCGMIRCLQMTAAQHNRLPLISLPCGLNIFCTEDSDPREPGYFLSLRICCISKGLSDPAEPNDSCEHSLFWAQSDTATH